MTSKFRKELAESEVESAGDRAVTAAEAVAALPVSMVTVAAIDPAASATVIADGGTPASWLKTEISWRETAVESIESKLPANVNCTTTSWMVFISGGGGDGEAGGKAWEGSSGGGGGNGDGGGGGNGDGGGGERDAPGGNGDGDREDVSGGGGEGEGGGGEGVEGGGRGGDGGEGEAASSPQRYPSQLLLKVVPHSNWLSSAAEM